MKRKISISFMALSVLVLLTINIMPHHHHEDVACFVVEHCEHDCSHEGHNHHHNDSDDCSSETCVAQSEYIPSSLNKEIKCPVSDCNDCAHHDHSLPSIVYFLVADLFNFDQEQAPNEYGEHISFYKSVEHVSALGLRAPPVVIG
ncbi:MAG: DUF6769 family protein [Mangrovibacterium sp.]